MPLCTALARRLIVLVAFCALLSKGNVHASPCETVSSLLKSAFFLYIREQVRGSSEAYLMGMFQASVRALVQFVRITRPNESSFGNICLTPEERNNLISVLSENGTKLWMGGGFVPIPKSAPSGNQMETENIYSTFIPSFSNDLDSRESTSGTTEVLADAFKLLGVERAAMTIEGMHNLYEPPSSHFSIKQLAIQRFAVSADTVLPMMRSVKEQLPLTSIKSSLGGILTKNIFYIPDSNLTAEHITHYNKISMSNEVLDTWSKIEEHLFEEPSIHLVPKLTVLPPTVSVYYEPNHRKIENRIDDQRKASPFLNAFELLVKVTAMVLSMDHLNVARNESLHLLKHAACHLFDTMRSDRKEGEELMVSPKYMALYYQKYRELTGSKRGGIPNLFHSDDVRQVYRHTLLSLLRFSSAGQLDCMITGRVGYWILYVDFEKSLFSTSKQIMLTALTYQRGAIDMFQSISAYLTFMSRMAFSRVRSASSLDPGVKATAYAKATAYVTANKVKRATRSTIPNAVVQQLCADNPGFIYFPKTTYTMDEQHCCALPCQNAEVVQSGSITMSDCCGTCNMYDCTSHGLQWVEDLKMVMTEDFGFYHMVRVYL